MERRGKVNARAEAVRDRAATVLVAEVRHPTADGEASAERDVRLDNMHAAIDQILEVPVSHVALSRCDRDGRIRAQLAIAKAVVLRERFFQPVDVERGEHLRPLLRRLDIPRVPGIDHQRSLIANDIPSCLDVREVVIRVLAERAPAELHGGQTEVDELTRHRGGLVRRVSEEDAGVSPNVFSMDLAQ